MATRGKFARENQFSLRRCPWFRHVIKDEVLAREAATIEADESLGTVEARKRLHDIVADRYTAPTQAA